MRGTDQSRPEISRQRSRLILTAADTIATRLRWLLEYCSEPLSDDEDSRYRADEILENVSGLVTGDAEEPRYLEFHSKPGESVGVVGDLHGDYSAIDAILREMFPPFLTDSEAKQRRVVFLGDLLDRGPRDLQLLHLVVLLARLLPGQVVLLRGNHEEFVVRDGRVRSSASENSTFFAVKFGEALGYNRMILLDHYFQKLPHFAVLVHPRGRIGFVHAGVPPAFLENRCRSPLEYFEVENVRRAFLWGRPMAADRKRPNGAYPYDQFYAEDVVDFCQSNNLALIMRGHDTTTRGYDRIAEGRMLTVFSSGTSAGIRGNESAYAGTVDLPRYVWLEHDLLFRGDRTDGEHRGIDSGIAIKEVHAKDVLVIVEDEKLSDHDSMIIDMAGRHVAERLAKTLGWPLHMIDRSRFEAGDLQHRRVFAVAADVATDESLDQSPVGRLHYALTIRDGNICWLAADERGSIRDDQLPVLQPILGEFAQLCLARITEDAEVELPDSPPTLEECS